MPRPKRQIRHSRIVDVFAERMRAVRIARGETQRELANKVNTGVTYITRLESGGAAPGIDMVERIAAALGVHPTELLPMPTNAVESLPKQIEQLTATVLAKAGPDSLSFMHQFLSRLVESTALSR